MQNSYDNVMRATVSGLAVLMYYDMGAGLWIKDILAEDWYFNSLNEGWRFKLLVEGEACFQIRKGENVTDKDLLGKLCAAKSQYFETLSGA